MNERIQELGDQAWDYALDHETVNGKAAFDSFINKNFSDLLLEKFAELIVRECMSIIKQGEGLGEEDDFDKGFQAGIAMAYNRVRTQMGVEKND